MRFASVFAIFTIFTAFTSSVFSQTTTYVIGTSPAATYPITNINDQAAVFQVFKNALLTLQTGGTLEIEAGTYVFSDSINIPANASISIKGAGAGLTILKLADNAQMPSGKIGLIHAENANTLTIQDLTLDGNSVLQNATLLKETRTGFYCTGCSTIVVKNVDAMGWRGNGFLFQPKLTATSSGITISNSSSIGNDFDGFGFKSVTTIDIGNTESSGNGGDGFSFTNCNGVTMHGINTTSNHRHGIYADNQTSTLAINNFHSVSDGHGVDPVSLVALNGCGIFLKGSVGGTINTVSLTGSNIENSNMTAVLSTAVNGLTITKSNLTGSVFCLKVSYTSGTVTTINCNAPKGIPPADPTSPSFTVTGVIYSGVGSTYVAPPPLNLLTRPTNPSGTPPTGDNSTTSSPDPNSSNDVSPSPSPGPTSGAGSRSMNIGMGFVIGSGFIMGMRLFM
jgi:hypothetical protein